MTDTTHPADTQEAPQVAPDTQIPQVQPVVCIGTFFIAFGRVVFSESQDFANAAPIVKGLTAMDIARLCEQYANAVSTPEDRQAYVDQLAAMQAAATSNTVQ